MRLVAPLEAVTFAGVAFYAALAELLGRDILVDCGDDAGRVLAGLRSGCRRLVFRGEAERRRRLQDIARQLGARVVRSAPQARLAAALTRDGSRCDKAPTSKVK